MNLLLPFLWNLTFPARAFAQTSLDPCQNGTGGVACVTSGLELNAVIAALVNFIFVIAVLAALGFHIWGGFKWLTSGGEKEGVENARSTIIAAIVGLILIFLSYVILNFVLIFLGFPGGIAGIEFNSITGGTGAVDANTISDCEAVGGTWDGTRCI